MGFFHHATTSFLSSTTTIPSSSPWMIIHLVPSTSTMPLSMMDPTVSFSSPNSDASLFNDVISPISSSSLSLFVDDLHGQMISRVFLDQEPTTILNFFFPPTFSFPLLLSCIAGASTCLGAAIVFLVDAHVIRRYMSFALSLAASVMLTVSAISIIPECLHGIVEIQQEYQNAALGGDDLIQSSNILRQQLQLPVTVLDSKALMERLTSFGLGCFSYWMLSTWLAVPEPEDLLFSSSSSSSLVSSSRHDHNKTQQRNQYNDRNTDNHQETRQPAWDKSIAQSLPLQPTIQQQGSSLVASPDTMFPNISDFFTKSTGSDSSENSSTTMTVSSVQDLQVVDDDDDNETDRYWRVTLLLFVSLLVHNFPEGLAVAASTMESSQLGIAVTVGILIHNVPEGIAIAVPCIAARPDAPWLAFWLASGSGLAEPLGAMVALAVLNESSSSSSAATTSLPLDNVLACVAGIMCAVACLELYPEAWRQHYYDNETKNTELDGSDYVALGSRHDSGQIILGSLFGIAIMVTTELYLAPQ